MVPTSLRATFATLAASFALAVAAPFASAQHGGIDPAGAGDGGHAGHVDAAAPHRSAPWERELLDLFGSIPIQEQGRIKPISTFAYFKLLELNGSGTFRHAIDDKGTADPADDEIEKLSPTEWLLDCMLFPEHAMGYRCFQLQTWEVLDALSIPRIDGRIKRDRYSYAELEGGRDKLAQITEKLRTDPRKSDAKNRTYVEEQLVQLSRKMNEFEGLIGSLWFAHEGMLAPPAGLDLAKLLPGDQVRLSTVIARTAELAAFARDLGNDPAAKGKLESLLQWQDHAASLAQFSSELTIYPPPATPGAKKPDAWLSLAEVADAADKAGSADSAKPHLPTVAALEHLWESRRDPAALKEAVRKLHDRVVDLATQRDEYAKIGSEISYYRADLFYRALIGFILCFVLVAAGWLVKSGHWLHRATPWVVAVPLLMTIAGIVWRCWLRSRPPVSSLYETIPFITSSAVLVSIVIELLDRRRVAIAFAAAIGAAGLFLTQRFEVKEAFDRGLDTMPQLVAVLDTNFWLSTHVTTVTIGYSAGLLAGLLAHVYVLGKLFGMKKGDDAFYKSISRMVYGVICFGLLFSVVGTILGGVWANDSWGRFWGWDPKENGALMICLFELAVLHARMGGYLRDQGLCNAAVFGTAVVSFSWWHVNQLGVGLHSYGETDGVKQALYVVYLVESLVVMAGIWLAMEERTRRRLAAANAAASKKPAAPRAAGHAKGAAQPN